ncbi:uncharacterized protein I206_105152 [Kwoniella pini CBS 10737]|uniref:FAD/NAD(P)-binding domain-containing protein n=1 Tax=Kwoniella pini CBS 10737 TaxID=1296096 RepID=A0A1B9I509_9TREE|nr:uncharacterized protein I206_03938 [Kwoniella pini CBS 10737]OCF50613.1 hypothetical protein I206_03938 [Kwoniella pini CBS 10737]
MLGWMMTTLVVGMTAQVAATPFGKQSPFLQSESTSEKQWHSFQQEIKKVAVIGAGPSGLQSAAALIKEGFEVRLIERSDAPGGNWYHNVLTPIRERYPNDDVQTASYRPDPRANSVEYYQEGDEGLTLVDRWIDHIRPSPIWDDLETNSAPVFTTLPGVEYPTDAAWALQAQLVQRHVRTYASTHGLNANDRPWNASAPQILYYSTRVEQLKKQGHTWKLSLKKLTRLPDSDKVKAEWWEEDFDAVVIATGGYQAAHVPDITGLVEWSKVRRSNGHHPVKHSQHYRNPELYKNKTVVIIGASVSASEISRRIGPHVEKLYISLRNTTRNTYMARRSIRRLYSDAEHIPEIVEFGTLPSNESIKEGSVRLANGTLIGGIDEVILATGFRRSLPFLKDYYSIGGKVEPHSEKSPILTDAHNLQSLSWTGHYISDPTLAFTTVRAWTFGRYQSLAFAKVWKRTARLPSRERLWDEYFNDNHWQAPAKVVFGSIEEETLGRQYVAWLNSESLIHGGRLVDQWPIQNREKFAYYSDEAWEHGYTSSDNFTRFENTPRSEWPTYRRAVEATYELDSGSEW